MVHGSVTTGLSKFTVGDHGFEKTTFALSQNLKIFEFDRKKLKLSLILLYLWGGAEKIWPGFSFPPGLYCRLNAPLKFCWQKHIFSLEI